MVAHDDPFMTFMAVVIPFLEYLLVVIAVTLVAVTGICAVAITRPGAQALVSAAMAYAGFITRKELPKSPEASSTTALREAQERHAAAQALRAAPGTALKLQSVD